MSAAERAKPLTAAEAKSLFSGLSGLSSLILAVSGGPDSTALLVLAARWRSSLGNAPKLVAVTIDHALRPESANEAKSVGRLARKLGVAHRIVRWNGPKPKSGLQQAARRERYRLLALQAKKSGARHIVTAHTLDDQAETVLIRLVRGSGLSGLSAMAQETVLEGVTILRPLLDQPKARLIATLRKEGIAFADDPSNRDPRFTRARLRGVMPLLAQEGLSARRLALLAKRLRRAEEALSRVVNEAAHSLSRTPWREGTRIELDSEGFLRLPVEIGLRLLGRAIGVTGDEGPVELAKLERLHGELTSAGVCGKPIRRTLAGSAVSLAKSVLIVERAPPRRPGTGRRISALTKGEYAAARDRFPG